MIGEIGNFKMKKLLLILLCLPMIGVGQDVPLTEKKVTTESMENKEQRQVLKEKTKRTKKYNRSLAMYPKNQIGLSYGITDFNYIGLNYHHYFSKNFGCYIDYKNDLNNDDNYWDKSDISFIEGSGGVKTNYQVPSKRFTVFNLGSTIRFAGDGISDFDTEANGWVYFGFGRSTEKLYDIYYDEVTYVRDYVRNGEIHKFNLNIGILLQFSAGASWQLGFNSTLNLLYFGLGFSW